MGLGLQQMANAAAAACFYLCFFLLIYCSRKYMKLFLMYANFTAFLLG